MIKVLYISNFKPDVGGISGQIQILMENLDPQRVTTEIFNTKGNFVRRFISFFSLLVKGVSFDVFHIHGCSYWGGFFPIIIGTIVGKILSKRIIITYHGGDAEKFFTKYPRITVFFLKKANKIIVLSAYLESIFQKSGLAVEVIPNVLNYMKVIDFRKKTLTPRFICIRALRPLYNIPCIIDAFEIIKKNYSEATLTLLGDGSQREDLEEYVKSKGLNGVFFIGRVENAKVNEYLQNADIMLSSPRIDNMPVSILEGFKAGNLVISSNVGGVPYIIEHGFNGLLFESNTPSDLAEKALFALKNQNKSLQMIENARLSLIKYTWEAVEEKFYALYV